VILLICRANAAEVGPNIRAPGAETGRLEIHLLSMLCSLKVLKPPYSQAKKKSTPIYGRRDKLILRRTARFSHPQLVKKKARDLLTFRPQGGKDFLQIDPELLVEVLADGPNGDVIHSSIHEILDGTDTMFDRPAGIPDFHPFT